MLNRVDRIQMTSQNAAATAQCWVDLLDGRILNEDHLDILGARRVIVQAGDSLIEILQPTGDGLAADHLAAKRGGPFSIGVTCANLSELVAHLESSNPMTTEEVRAVLTV